VAFVFWRLFGFPVEGVPPAIIAVFLEFQTLLIIALVFFACVIAGLRFTLGTCEVNDNP